MTTSLSTHCHFLVFLLGAENNDEPLSSLLSFGFFPEMQKLTMSWEAPSSSSSLGFFLRCKRQR